MEDDDDGGPVEGLTFAYVLGMLFGVMLLLGLVVAALS